MKNVMITTSHRGVFLAQVHDDNDLTRKTLTDLYKVRMVIRWRNGQGLSYMALHGPTQECKLAPAIDWPVIHDVTSVAAVTDDAAAKIWPDEA